VKHFSFFQEQVQDYGEAARPGALQRVEADPVRESESAVIPVEAEQVSAARECAAALAA
jgi:hypothetical protein